MNATPILAEIPWVNVIIGVGSLLFVFFIFVIIYASWGCFERADSEIESFG